MCVSKKYFRISSFRIIEWLTIQRKVHAFYNNSLRIGFVTVRIMKDFGYKELRSFLQLFFEFRLKSNETFIIFVFRENILFYFFLVLFEIRLIGTKISFLCNQVLNEVTKTTMWFCLTSTWITDRQIRHSVPKRRYSNVDTSFEDKFPFE